MSGAGATGPPPIDLTGVVGNAGPVSGGEAGGFGLRSGGVAGTVGPVSGGEPTTGAGGFFGNGLSRSAVGSGSAVGFGFMSPVFVGPAPGTRGPPPGTTGLFES